MGIAESVGKFNITEIFNMLIENFFMIIKLPIRLIMAMPAWLRGFIVFLMLMIGVGLLWWYRKHKDDYLRVKWG